MTFRLSRMVFTHGHKHKIRAQARAFSSKFNLYGDLPIPANKQGFIPKSGTYPAGFLVGSINAGIKDGIQSQPDLVLVASDRPTCNGAAVFTKNEFPAPSIIASRNILRNTQGRCLRGVIANSWCANLFNGKPGFEDSIRMMKEADKYVSGVCSPELEPSVMVMHTGPAGKRLPIDNIIQSMPKLYQAMGNSHEHWLEAAKAICTTDTFPKLASRTFTLPSPSRAFSIAGITKGAGMIHPNMATTLGIICTDAPVTPRALQALLSAAADKSYNCISVEGDTSTNDMVAMLANGAAGGDEIDLLSEDFGAFQGVLTEFMAEMAKLVVRDGEGATKFITIRIRGSPSYPVAKKIASVVARSVLFKIAAYGNSSGSWGSVIAAVGSSLMDTEFAGKGIIVPDLMSLSFMPVNGAGRELKLMERGLPLEVDAETLKRMMEQEDIEVVANLRDDGSGAGEQDNEAVYWTCDLSHEFVTVNGE